MKLKIIGAEYHRVKYEHMQNFTMFEDKDFPADEVSLFYSGGRKNVTWVRPTSILKTPLLFHAKKIYTAALDLGLFSNTWLGAALDAIVQNPAIFSFVVPPDQNFVEDYVGVFRFRIWRFGTWCEVTIDDRLPFDADEGTLLGLTSLHGDFWAPLLEKAYAKVLGRYEDLSFIQTNDALTDLTGGLAEMYATNWNPEVMYHALRTAIRAGSFVMAYKIDRTRYPRVEQAWVHAFITAIEPLKTPPFRFPFDGSALYVRLRVTNEFLLLYREDEQFYYANLATEAIEEEHNLTRVEGEIWMKFDSMRSFFVLFSIIHVPWYPGSPLVGVGGGIHQRLTLYPGEWVPGRSAGSCFSDPNIHHNLRYSLTLEHPDEGLTNLQTVVIGLMQKDRRLALHSKSTKINYIGFHVYAQKKSLFWRLPVDFTRPVDKGRYFNVKEYCRRFRLPLGNYVVVPCTVKPNREGKYLLRILTETRGHVTLSQRIVHELLRVQDSLTFSGFRNFLFFIVLVAFLIYYFLVRGSRRKQETPEKSRWW